MKVSTRPARWLACAAILAGALGYLRDPPWVGRLTSGLRSWEEDPPGRFFRWTNGRATFFVPATANELTLPLRAVFPGPNGAATTVEIRSDDRWLATIVLSDPAVWERPRLPLGRAGGSRRYRRIDLRVNRVVGPYILGVMTGEIEVDATPLPR
jgi:hypothetical protein